jgi:predicted ATP-grasp superfamily ATP-dependent carboligase
VRALLIDEGRDRASLVGARALAADGWTVGCAAGVRSLASRSRACDAFHLLTPLASDPERFCADVAAAMSDGDYEIVFPTWEAATSALSAYRSHLPGCFPFPEHDVLMRCFDKSRLAEAAQACGIASPLTAPATPEAIAGWSYPALVKPASHAEGFYRATLVHDAQSARDYAQAIATAGGRPLIQERIEGSLVAIAFVADRQSQLLTVSQQRAELTWPRGVGVTARGVTEPPDRALIEKVSALVAHLRWWGLAQVQFLRGADGIARVIDFNGRYYGSMALAINAGVNHPAAWARTALEMPVPQMSQRDGIRYQWLTRDLRASVMSGHPTQIARALACAPRSAHSLYVPSEPMLAPRFLASQLRRSLARRLHLA